MFRLRDNLYVCEICPSVGVNPIPFHSFCLALLKLNEKPRHKCGKTEVNITWNKPKKSQSLDEAIFFDVECFLCKEKTCTMCKNVNFSPRSKRLLGTSVRATNLQPDETYKFRVYPRNGMNDETLIPKEKWKYNETKLFSCQSSMSFCTSFILSFNPLIQNRWK